MTTTSAPSRRAVAYGLGPLMALSLTNGLQSGEQIGLSQAVDGIKASFHASDLQLGLLPLAMAVTGLLGAIPIGRLTDLSRRTRLVAIATLVWTAFMFGAGLSVSLLMLYLLRMGLGAIEASSMAAHSLISDYYPVAERAKRLGQYAGGSLVGALFAFAIGGVLVDHWGWRASFFMWIPFAIGLSYAITRLPEPQRGDQDADHAQLLAGAIPPPFATAVAEVRIDVEEELGQRASTASWGPVLRRLRTIPSFWFAAAGITVSGLLLNASQFWGIPYFKRVHHLSTGTASAVAGALGVGSAAGILLGGFISDRLLRRGVLNARPYVAATSAVLSVAFLTPAWAIHDLHVTAPLFVIGSAFLTGAIPPTEAMLADVVMADMRGRAATIRSIGRVLSNTGPFLVAAIATAFGGTGGNGLRLGLTIFTSVMAIAAVGLLLSARTYPRDLAAVCDESERIRAAHPTT